MTRLMRTEELFSLEHTAAEPFLKTTEYPWQALPGIGNYILSYGKMLPEDEYERLTEDIWVARDAEIFPTAYLHGPCIIGHRAQIRQCAFIRGNALVGDDCVVGNSTELKNVILFDCVQVPHYNYVGDSILGYKAHMGAGSITSNVKSDKSLVVIAGIETGRKKVGAMLGDGVEIGCNTVLNPGTVIGRNTSVYPLSSVRGVVPADSIYKSADEIVPRR